MDGDFADATGRHVEDAQKGDIILWMKEQTNIGEGVLDLGALVKTETADDAVANADAAQRFLERPRLRGGAVQNSESKVGVFAKKFGDFSGDVLGFVGSVAGFVVRQQSSGAESRSKVFAEAGAIVADDAAGGVENYLRGTVVFFKANGLSAGKVLKESLKIAAHGATPTVD